MRPFLAELDKAGAEWVVVAYLANDGNMLQVVQSGDSPHTHTGALISGADKEFVEKENKIVGNNTDPQTIHALREDLEIDEEWYLPRTMSIRQAGKKSNHGLNYDLRYKGFALHNEIDEGEAKKLVELYHSSYPGIRQWHKRTENQLRDNRILTNCFGRKRRFMDAWGPQLFDAAYSFVPQSTVFDCTRLGMVGMYNDPDITHTELLAQVHDSLLNQCHHSNYTDAAKDLIKIGLDYMNPVLKYNEREFQIGTTIKVGYDWGHMEECSLTEDPVFTGEGIREALEKYGKEKVG